jgi:hypothetical protein
VTGSILLNTPSGTATCYGTIQLSGPATGDFIELGGTNGNVQMLGLLVIADKADFSSVSVQTLEIASLACGNDPAEATLSSEISKTRSSPPLLGIGFAPPLCARDGATSGRRSPVRKD